MKNLLKIFYIYTMIKKYNQYIKENQKQKTIGDKWKEDFGFELQPANKKEKIFLDRPAWSEDHECFIFALRGPDGDKHLDMWLHVDYDNPKEVARQLPMMKLRAQLNPGTDIYAIWLPDIIAQEIIENDNPEDYMYLLTDESTCNKCDTKNQSNAKFCRECGNKLRKVTSTRFKI